MSPDAADTMAQYRPETFEVLAHTETVKKLVTQLGYPEVRSATCDVGISCIHKTHFSLLGSMQ